ncbi:plasmid mobilization protein [Streptococcus suis]|uniref:plasmid mobilization protein n=1 Tax=Streptococcus suis TaxID=1307 RepID=UPI00040DF1EA|nr:CopG family transcriptional regulator [Streptococcus suis]
MTKKMGRPLKVGEKRDKRIEFRLTENELDLVNITAEKAGLTRVDLVVKAVEEFADRLE